MPDDPRDSPLWPAHSPAATSHITVLQGIITRLANNSAACKTWSLTLVAAVLSVANYRFRCVGIDASARRFVNRTHCCTMPAPLAAGTALALQPTFRNVAGAESPKR